jgi:predicted secreted protein
MREFFEDILGVVGMILKGMIVLALTVFIIGIIGATVCWLFDIKIPDPPEHHRRFLVTIANPEDVSK